RNLPVSSTRVRGRFNNDGGQCCWDGEKQVSMETWQSGGRHEVRWDLPAPAPAFRQTETRRAPIW
ncbi:MAG TPA: hypothetical protein VG963_12685, partial [Polyangiaceae bacterium]|nr:hypothetical protein [Polyangiaceae bacterium]